MLELFSKAGFIAYPLGLSSILVVGIILERFYAYIKLNQLEEQAFVALQAGLANDNYIFPNTANIAGAPVTQVMESLKPLQGSSEETIRHAADIAISMQRLRLRRYLNILATIGSTAPFVGLFGTVLGVMGAFNGMSTGGGLNSGVMANGISEALSATALGLLVAVPSVIAYNFFLAQVQRMMLNMQDHVARLAPLLSERHTPVRAR